MDKRQEEQEERCQEFRIQVKMQRQQMQNQQNMLAVIVIMMSMMGGNASGPVRPDEGIVKMCAGRSTEQRNDRQGGNSNTHE